MPLTTEAYNGQFDAKSTLIMREWNEVMAEESTAFIQNKIEKITNAIHEGDIHVATLSVAYQIRNYRSVTSASLADASEAVHSACAKVYQDTYHDGEAFENMWAGVEDGLRRMFD